MKCITVVGCPLISGRPKSVVVPKLVSLDTVELKYTRSLPKVATRLLLKSHWPRTYTPGLITVNTAAGGGLVTAPAGLETTTSYEPPSVGCTLGRIRFGTVLPGRFVPLRRHW